MQHHDDHRPHDGEPVSLTRSAVQATLHCLTGCAIGEVLGMVLATSLGWGNTASNRRVGRAGVPARLLADDPARPRCWDPVSARGSSLDLRRVIGRVGRDVLQPGVLTARQCLRWARAVRVGQQYPRSATGLTVNRLRAWITATSSRDDDASPAQVRAHGTRHVPVGWLGAVVVFFAPGRGRPDQPRRSDGARRVPHDGLGKLVRPNPLQPRVAADRHRSVTRHDVGLVPPLLGHFQTADQRLRHHRPAAAHANPRGSGRSSGEDDIG